MISNEEYWKQGQDRLEEYHKQVMDLVGLMPEPRRGLVLAMLKGPIGMQFMTAPASTRRAYHNAFPCGLVAHSLGVVKNSLALAKTLAPGKYPIDRIVFCALFHDLGKAGSPGLPFYREVSELWKRDKGEFYEYSHDEWMPNAEKSLFLLQLHGIKVSHEEALAIRLNDGMGSESNRAYSFREPGLSLIVHWADHWQMRTEKEEAGEFPL